MLFAMAYGAIECTLFYHKCDMKWAFYDKYLTTCTPYAYGKNRVLIGWNVTGANIVQLVLNIIGSCHLQRTEYGVRLVPVTSLSTTLAVKYTT